MALPAHALRAVQVVLKSVGNEVCFTLEAETVFRPYLPSHCSCLNEISHMAPLAHALRAVQVRLKSDSNEGHFTLEAEKVFRPYLATHGSGVTQTSNLAQPRLLHRRCKFGQNRALRKGTLLFSPKQPLIPVSLCIATG
jgi:hypothetical protein